MIILRMIWGHALKRRKGWEDEPPHHRRKYKTESINNLYALRGKG